MTTKDYISYIKKIFEISADPDHDLGLNIDIRRDWKILFAFFLVASCVVIIVDLYFFNNSRLFGGGVAGTGSVDEVKLDKSKLDEVIKVWQIKTSGLSKHLEMREILVDPSR